MTYTLSLRYLWPSGRFIIPRASSSHFSLLSPVPDGLQKQNNAFVSLCLAFSMEKFPVKLYVYDISRGLARQLSPLLLGKFARWIVREKIVYSKFVVFYAAVTQQIG